MPAAFQPSHCALLRPHPRARRAAACPSRPVFSSLSAADDVILEGDLVAYRLPPAPRWTVAAVVSQPAPDTFTVRPVVQRALPAENGTVELFVDWDPAVPETSLAAAASHIRLLDADFEERVVQDRIENPHGELSEYCWRVRPAALRAATAPFAPPDL